MEHEFILRTGQTDELDRLHQSLRSTFVSLPSGDAVLTSEQLDAIFGGDRNALRDIARLVFQLDEIEENEKG